MTGGRDSRSCLPGKGAERNYSVAGAKRLEG
jgi:hypothetical protein